MTQLTEVSELIVSYKTINLDSKPITSPEEVYRAIRPFFDDNVIGLQEMFVAMYLNKANKVLGAYRLSLGGITGTVADIRIILGTALKLAATGLILAHNHPSGRLLPSQQDEVITQRIKEACRLLEISLLDHLIISPVDAGYFSFGQEGIL